MRKDFAGLIEETLRGAPARFSTGEETAHFPLPRTGASVPWVGGLDRSRDARRESRGVKRPGERESPGARAIGKLRDTGRPEDDPS